MSKEVMKLALEALQGLADYRHTERVERALSALREALAEQPAPVQQEPKKDLMYSTVAMQERHAAFVDRAVATLEQAKREALAEQPAQQDSACSNALRAQGKAYPRTCKKCGLGPCVELAQQALDKMAENARELRLDYEPVPEKFMDALKFDVAMREALAEQPCVACEGNPQHPNSPCAVCGCKADQPVQQGRVAWTLLLTGEHHGLVGKAGEKFVGAPEYYERVDVYTSPQRTWVGLTFGQFHNILQKHKDIGSAMGAVEKTLREQNT